MSVIGSLNTLAMVGLTSSFVSSYGQKTAGYVQLLSLQEASPIPFEVPPAWAIPPRSEGRVTSEGLKCAFASLTAGLRGPAVLMARGSSLNERPSESPTLFFPFDFQDPAASCRIFEAKVNQVLETNQDMGVLATVLVGGIHVFRDGVRAAGWNSASFVADSHHPMAPNDMHITAVTGLGTRAVAAGTEGIFITADRRDGSINSFVNKTQQAFLRPVLGSRPCFDRQSYRQKQGDYFDLSSGAIVSRDLEEEFFDRSRASQEFGVTPFKGLSPLMNLVGLLRYLSGEAGPVQIEGAFPDGSSLPYLYQLQPTPESRVSLVPLGIRRRDIVSHQVVGVSDFTGPLLWSWGASAAVLREIDRRFAGSGYILMNRGQEGALIEATPHCRIRLATDQLNIGSHAVALARLKMRENPDAGYLLAQNVRLMDARQDAIAGRRQDEERDGVHVFHRAHLESNGSEMAVEILSGVA